MRVVSLLPSATETLAGIGGSSLLVGRSGDCDHPPSVASVPALTRPLVRGADPGEVDRQVRERLGAGGIEALDAEGLAALAPDLILLQEACGVCGVHPPLVHQALSDAGLAPRLLFLNANGVEDMLDAAIAIGDATGLEREAEAAVTGWRDRLHRALDLTSPYVSLPRAAALEWTDPLFIAGGWMAQMIERAGAEHPLSPTRALPGAGAGAGAHAAHRIGGPARQIDGRELAAARIETLIVAPCGEPVDVALRHVDRLSSEPWWEELPAVRRGRVIVADGRLLSRPGPRLIDAQEWLVSVLAGRPEADPGTVEHRFWRG